MNEELFPIPHSPPRSRPRHRSSRWQPAWIQHLLDDGPVDVSVCIANWNCREHLQTCLESLHDRPQGVRVETIVVDNASHDGSADMVAREFPEVVLIRNSHNVGFSRANNQAAARARGAYLLFLNNDTELAPGTLRRLLEYATAHPEVGLVGPRLRDPDGRVQCSWRPRLSVAALLHRTMLLRWTGLLRKEYLRFRARHEQTDQILQVDILMGAAMLIPREVFDTVGGWDESFTFGGEDMELSERIGRCYQVVYHPHIEILHHGRSSSRQHPEYAAVHIPAGFVRHLRKAGAPPWALRTYKLALSLDAPLEMVAKVLQFAWRRLQGRRVEASASLRAAREKWCFVTRGLFAFWRA